MPNCKPGDLAVIIDALSPENIGSIVKVIRPVASGDRLPSGRQFAPYRDGPYWLIEAAHPLLLRMPGHAPYYDMSTGCADSQLQPIRPPGLKAETESTRSITKETTE